MPEITTNEVKVIEHLKQGKIVALPTETVYGLAAIASNEEAIKKVYELKQRPLDHPLILHVSPKLDLFSWAKNISPAAKELMQAFWPGPLTLVFERGHVLDCITAGQNTVAIRCPLHPATQRILAALGEPLVMPSANPFGKVSPTTAEHVQESFQEKDLLILDGGRCTLGIESTIISAMQTSFGKILRPGALTKEMLDSFLNAKIADNSKAKSIKVPGQLKKHYQPEKPVFIFDNFHSLLSAYQQKEKPIFVLAFHKTAQITSEYFFHLSSSPTEVAFELYYQLRRADKSEAKAIYIELPPLDEKWEAITDRIIKAAG